MGRDDAELMRRWQRGEAAAFEALVRRWQVPLGRFLARVAGRDAAADLCQEVFVRVYLAGSKYRERGAFSTWLYQIAVNAARDAARRRPPPAQLATDEVVVEPAALDALEQGELAQKVEQALADLPPSLREVLVLRHYENMKFEQMARTLGVPASTLKSRFAVALERMQVRLQQLGWTPEETIP